MSWAGGSPTPEQRAAASAARKRWWENLTPEQRQARSAAQSAGQVGKKKPGQSAAMTGRTASLDTKAKISAALKGKPKSEAHVQKLRIANLGKPSGPRDKETRSKIGKANFGKRRTPEQRALMSERRKARWSEVAEEDRRAHALRATEASQRANPSSIELLVAQVLGAVGVVFIPQYRIGRYIADFYVPSRNLVIECDGTYWHSFRKEADARRDAYLIGQGYRVVRLSEEAIRESLGRCVLEAV